MADVTVSSDIDTLLKTANNAAARAALGPREEFDASAGNVTVAAGTTDFYSEAGTVIGAARTVTLPALSGYSIGDRVTVSDAGHTISAGVGSLTVEPNGAETFIVISDPVITLPGGFVTVQKASATEWALVTGSIDVIDAALSPDYSDYGIVIDGANSTLSSLTGLSGSTNIVTINTTSGAAGQAGALVMTGVGVNKVPIIKLSSTGGSGEDTGSVLLTASAGGLYFNAVDGAYQGFFIMSGGASLTGSDIIGLRSTEAYFNTTIKTWSRTTVEKGAIGSPAAGMIVFDTDLDKLCVYTGSAWETITSV